MVKGRQVEPTESHYRDFLVLMRDIRRMLMRSSRAGVPKPWATDQYRSVAC